jgi:FKBP-type peptidyl-prolyl cis-trans isomerase 2
LIFGNVFFMQAGSIVEINYTGKVVVSGEVFESTIEKKAIEAGIFNKDHSYGPFAVIVGEGDVLKGLDNALLEMKVGEERKVSVKPAEGWGERSSTNIAVVPLQQFRLKKIAPVPGLVVELNGRQARIQSVSGGRVRVDFNHPLAGKDLDYELKIEREITLPKEQVEALYKKYFFMVPDAEKKLVIGKEEVEVTLSPRYSANLGPLKNLFSEMISKHVKGFEKVRFVEEFVKEAKEGKNETKEKGGSLGKSGGKGIEKGKPAKAK